MTREEQIELMKECIEDAEVVLGDAHDPLLRPSLPSLKVAFKFFDYRMTQRHVGTEDFPYTGFMRNFGESILAQMARSKGWSNAADIPSHTPHKTPDVEED